MTPAAILATVEAKGAKLHLVDGDKIAITPRGAADDRLRDAIKAHKPELLELLRASDPTVAPSVAADMLATYGTREDLAVQVWARQHGHPDVLRVFGQLARRVDALANGTDESAYHVAVARLAGCLTAIRAAYEAATAPDAPEPVVAIAPTWRLVVKSMGLRPAPIRLDRAQVVVDNVPGFAEALLAKLAIAVEHCNAGRATYYTESIDEWLAELKLCGVIARLESVQ